AHAVHLSPMHVPLQHSEKVAHCSPPCLQGPASTSVSEVPEGGGKFTPLSLLPPPIVPLPLVVCLGCAPAAPEGEEGFPPPSSQPSKSTRTGRYQGRRLQIHAQQRSILRMAPHR